MQKNSTRRDFLTTSITGAAAATGLSLARTAHAAGDGTIKIGMIGCGGRCSGAAAREHEGRPRRQAGRHVRRLRRPPAGQPEGSSSSNSPIR